jgi:bacteriorhodopsin
MGFSALAFLAHAHFWVPRKSGDGLEFKIFHYITAAICFVACIAYFTMASNLGYAAIPVEFPRNDPLVRGLYREIFYVRYIDWFVTTPVSGTLCIMQASSLSWCSSCSSMFS